MVQKSKDKLIAKKKFSCPYCQKSCTVTVRNKTVTPAVAAVKEQYVTVEKTVQKTLR